MEEVLQHHFDVVFNALQDKENFEIFTGLKQIKMPRVKKTLVKIVRSNPTPPPTPPPNYSQTTTDTESMTSTFSLVSKSARSKRGCFVSSTIPEQKQESAVSIAGKLYFMPPREERKKIAARNTLFECKYCGRYVLGDFLGIHEAQCGDESMSHEIH